MAKNKAELEQRRESNRIDRVRVYLHRCGELEKWPYETQSTAWLKDEVGNHLMPGLGLAQLDHAEHGLVHALYYVHQLRHHHTQTTAEPASKRLRDVTPKEPE